MFNSVVRVVFILLAAGSQLLGQSSAEHKSSEAKKSVEELVSVQKLRVASELAGPLYDPLKCDGGGNVYYLSNWDLRKLNPKGERLAEFRPEANPDMPIDLALDFAVAPGGEVYMLVFPHEITRYLFSFKPDGSYRSAIKLDPGFPWSPSAFAVFPTGGFLISGRRYERDEKNELVMTPFTGVFGTDGKLLKELKLKDDDDLYDMAASGDPRAVSPGAPGTNLAVDLSRMEVGDDGNIYLMRWTNPIIIYAISPGGEVIRRFTVDPGNAGYHPVTMHIAGRRIAVLFTKSPQVVDLMEVVDLEGHPVATYSERESGGAPVSPRSLGTAFACYAADPERFVFLSVGDNNQLEIATAEPR